MKTIHRTYRYALLPNKVQQTLLDKHFGCVRYIYNYFLNQHKEQYESLGKPDNYYAQARSLVALKKQEETIWLKEVNSQTLQFALRCLNTAFTNFFSAKAEAPVYKCRKKKNSFTVPQFARVEGDRLHFPKFNSGIKINLHRSLQGEIRRCTLSRTPTGKYFVSILCEVAHTPTNPTGKRCGVDLGIKDFAVTSDDVRFKNGRYFQTYQRQLAKAQRHLSRKVKGSNNRNKQRLKVAKIHEKIANTRLNTLHQVSTQIINEYDIIAVEDLNVKGMMANHKLAKHIADASWGTFLRLLEYKAAWNDKRFVKISRWFASSKTCNECGWVNKELKLSQRVWTCANGHVLDRDLNASKNILKEGLKIISSGTGENTCRDLHKPSHCGKGVDEA